MMRQLNDAKQRQRFLATHDSLTNLPNRYLFMAHLSSALAEAERAKRVREGPEFKCFNCNKWFPGSLTYYLSKDWRPTLKYNINFLCGPKCATALSGKD